MSPHSTSFIQSYGSSTKYIIDRAIHTKRVRSTEVVLNEEKHSLCWKRYRIKKRGGIDLESKFYFRTKSGINRYFKNIIMFLHAPYVKYLYHMVSILMSS